MPVWCLAGSAVLAGLLALGSYTPVYGLLWHLPFLGGLRFPLRYQFWTSFCFACLGAIGLHRALEWNGRASSGLARLRPFLPLGALVTAAAALFWRVRPARHTELIACILLLTAAAAVVWSLSAARRPLAVLAGINLLLVADLSYFRFYAGYAPTTGIARALRSDGLAGWLRQDPGRFRVLSVIESENLWFLAFRPDLQQGDFRMQNLLLGSSPPLWDLESVQYHGSLELRRFEKVMRGLTGTLLKEPRQAATLTPFLDFLQAKYVVARRELVFDGWEKVREDGGMAAWRIPGFRGGEFLVGRVERENTPGEESIVAGIRARPVDFRQTAVIAAEELPELGGAVEGAQVRRGPARYDAMSFQVKSGRRALLVIPTNYYPGWTATVNGQPARIYRTNWIGMGVVVEAGESAVEMRFTTPGFHAGLGLSLVSLAVWLGLAILGGRLRLLRVPDAGPPFDPPRAGAARV
jgi:hypothetical protein